MIARRRPKRIERLQGEMALSDLAGLVLSDPVDLRYLTDLTVSCGTLLVPRKGSPVFLVDDRYLERAREVIPAERSSPSAKESWLGSLNVADSELRIGIDSAKVSVAEFDEITGSLTGNPSKPLKWVKVPHIVQQLRGIKDSQEIAAIERAAELGARGFDYLLSRLRVGVRERDLVRELEIFWLLEGGEGPSFEPIIAFGESASRPHHLSGSRRLKSGDLVLIDLGVRLNGYCSDFTRTFFFARDDAALDSLLVRAWRSTTRALAAARQLCTEGRPAGDLDAAARSALAQDGLAERFTHGLGHGVGLEVHEAPRLRADEARSLQRGQVVTLEPGVYIEGRGGVRQEDLFAVQIKGCRPLVERPHALLFNQFK